MPITATKLKITTVLSTAEMAKFQVPNCPRLTVRVQLPDRVLSVDVATKSLRKAQAAIAEHGADNIVVVLQGALIANDTVAEAGISAQVKGAKKEQPGVPAAA
jgi:hypothetical protein